jgi:hypothetical protein
MNKEKLIHQVLNETNIELYNFWVMKLLKEYPEYQQKIINNWIKRVPWSSYKYFKIKEVRYNKTGIFLFDDHGDTFKITCNSDLEREMYLNWTLREENYE